MTTPSRGPRAALAVRTGRHAARNRRRAPGVEELEGRAVPALSFGTAFGIGGVGFGVTQIALDSAGNTYVTGSFEGTVNFDPAGGSHGILTAGATNFSSFVAKYSPSDALVWVDDFTPPAGDTMSNSTGLGLAVASNTGAVYVGGTFSGSIVFAAGSNAAQTDTTNAKSNGFVVKLNPDGSFVPADVLTFGGSSPNVAGVQIVKVSPDGSNIYVGGYYNGSVSFASGGMNVTLNDPYPSGVSDDFLLDLSSDFSLRYAVSLEQYGGSVNDINADDSGHVYVAGVETEASGNAAYVEEFDASGTVTHATDFGGLASGVAGTNAAATGVVLDASGNVYISGDFTGTSVPFGPFAGSSSVTLTSAGDFDMFLLKLDPSFDLVWANRFGSTGADGANDLAIDGDGHLLVGGFLAGPSNYGTSASGPAVLGTTGSAEMGCVLEVDSNGALVGATTATGTGKSAIISIAANASDQVVVDGAYAGTPTFGSATLGQPGAQQGFLAAVTGASTPTLIMTSHIPTPTPTLVLIGETPVTTGKGKHKKTIGFELEFSGVLASSVAQSTSHYRVVQPGRTRKAAPKVIAVRTATVGPGGTSVTLTLGKYVTSKPLTVTGIGLAGANGSAVTTFTTEL